MNLRNFLANTVLLATMSAPSFGMALPVKNFSHVGNSAILLRGAQPGSSASDLRSLGVDDVLIFKNDTRGEVAKEISTLLSSGFTEEEVHHIPMAWKNIDYHSACEQTFEALEILSRKTATGRTVFFHCTAGEDRTGLLAGLYRVLHEMTDAEEIYQEELCEKGYADGNSDKPALVSNQIHEGLTPLYFHLAEKITQAKQKGRKIGNGLCRDFNPQPVEVFCR